MDIELKDNVITMKGKIITSSDGNSSDLQKLRAILDTFSSDDDFIVKIQSQGGSGPDALKLMYAPKKFPNAKYITLNY